MVGKEKVKKEEAKEKNANGDTRRNFKRWKKEKGALMRWTELLTSFSEK